MTNRQFSQFCVLLLALTQMWAYPQTRTDTGSGAPRTDRSGTTRSDTAAGGIRTDLNGGGGGGGGAMAPAAPSNLVATTISDCEIGLTWQRNDTTPAAASYLLERSDDGGTTWHTQQSLPAGANIWTDVSGFLSTTYKYRISAVASGGATSSASSVATATTSGAITSTYGDPTSITVSTPTATTASIGYTNPNTPSDVSHLTYVLERSDDGGYNYHPVDTTTLRDNGGGSQSTNGPIPDFGLTPGKTYFWRVRGLTVSNPTNYVGPISATMPARTSGYPIEPSGTAVVNNSGTTNTLTWTDNSGGSASFLVERATWALGAYSFSQIGTASAGVTTYTDTTATALQSYVYRIRAHNGTGNSDYDIPVFVTTASSGTGAGTTYTIGPGQTYTDPGAFPWSTVKPGDTVNIVGNGSTYNEPLLISCRGTAANGITINGVAGSDGKLPIFDGTNATFNSQFQFNASALGTMGGMIFYKNGSPSTAYRPGYITLQNIEVKNFWQGDPSAWPTTPITGTANSSGKVEVTCLGHGYTTGYSIKISGVVGTTEANGTWTITVVDADHFTLNGSTYMNAYVSGGTAARPNIFTDYTGVSRTYGADSIGIYVLSGDHLTFQNCYVHGNGEGIFAAGQDVFNRAVTDITLRANYITGNGNIGGSLDHNSYVECLHPLYEYNVYGPVRSGSSAIAIKERSIGPVIRYNVFYTGAQILDFVESQNEASTSICNPDYGATYFYGNEVHLDTAICSNFSLIGGDNGDVGWYRKGIVYVYNNTFVCTLTGAGHVQLFNCQTNAQSVDARNNIFSFFTYGGATSLNEYILSQAGQVYLGTNWITSGYGNSNSSLTGHIAGTGNLITGTAAGFANIASSGTLDLHLAGGSPCVDAGGVLSGALASYPVNYQFLSAVSWPNLAGVARATVGIGPDVGAYERDNVAGQ
jgi:hypothetical protein